MFKWLTALRTIVESCSDPAKSCWEPAKSEQCTYRAEAGNSRIGWEEGWKAGFDNSRPSSVLLLGGVQPCSAFNWRRPFGDTFRSTLFSGVELVSFNFGLPGWVGFLEVFGKKKDWDL